MTHTPFRRIAIVALAIGILAAPALAQKPGLQASDIYRLRSVGDVQISPDGRTAVYAVVNNDRPGRPYSQLWLLDVPIAEAEQFFIALKGAGVETVLVRYPREGHGIREVKHVEDTITRSLDWYKTYFGSQSTRRAPSRR